MGNDIKYIAGGVATVATGAASIVTLGQVDAINKAWVACADFTEENGDRSIIGNAGVAVIGGAFTAGGAIATVATLGQSNDVIQFTRRAAEETAEWATIAVSETIDVAKGTPGVGHAIGVGELTVGLATDDEELVDKSMKTFNSANRTTWVIGGAIAGSVGGIPGAVAGGIAGGASYDGLDTAVSTIRNDKYTPKGQLKNIDTIVQAKNFKEVAWGIGSTALTTTLDGVVGYCYGKSYCESVPESAAANQTNSASSAPPKTNNIPIEEVKVPQLDKITRQEHKEIMKAFDDILGKSEPQFESKIKELFHKNKQNPNNLMEELLDKMNKKPCKGFGFDQGYGYDHGYDPNKAIQEAQDEIAKLLKQSKGDINTSAPKVSAKNVVDSKASEVKSSVKKELVKWKISSKLRKWKISPNGQKMFNVDEFIELPKGESFGNTTEAGKKFFNDLIQQNDNISPIDQKCMKSIWEAEGFVGSVYGCTSDKATIGPGFLVDGELFKKAAEKCNIDISRIFYQPLSRTDLLRLFEWIYYKLKQQLKNLISGNFKELVWENKMDWLRDVDFNKAYESILGNKDVYKGLMNMIFKTGARSENLKNVIKGVIPHVMNNGSKEKLEAILLTVFKELSTRYKMAFGLIKPT